MRVEGDKLLAGQCPQVYWRYDRRSAVPDGVDAARGTVDAGMLVTLAGVAPVEGKYGSVRSIGQVGAAKEQSAANSMSGSPADVPAAGPL